MTARVIDPTAPAVGPTAADLDLVAAVEHADPHAVLGPHVTEAGLLVRAFRPDATAITVRPDDASIAPVAMRRVHGLGIFEGTLPGVKRPIPYRLDVEYPKDSFSVRDPYAFPPVLGALDLHLAAEGKHQTIYRRLGAHVREIDGVSGTSFAVWAPNARRVSVTGSFNSWDGRLHAMRRMGGGIWEIFVPDLGDGALYKYEILTPGGRLILKSDPYAAAMELRPHTASKVVTKRHVFGDAAWMAARAAGDPHRKPMSIYEVHLGSWKRVPRRVAEGEPPLPPEQATRWLTYRELADELVDYVADLGFTHVELLPVMEHPYDGSWGYQITGYFAPTSRFGTPDDLRYFVDRCHQKGIGVLLDWTPAHFPKDAFALGRFDGEALYEHPDPRRGEHRHWGTFIFDYGRWEVRNFLVASALYWLDEFHVDGLRVDAVASMLYLDYSADGPDDWLPNKFGGRENLEAVAFLRELNDLVHAKFPGAIVAAEESTTWPGVTRPTYLGGLGFDFKWNMGWMHDTLDYFSFDPIHRAFHHGKITFGLMYAFSERFILPLSHDEVVHLKKSLLSKLPGDRWKQLATLRALYAHMWAHPGKKLLFMGGELGQRAEWNEAVELEWARLADPGHKGLFDLVRDLNRLYARYPALWELDDHPSGFVWIDANDAPQSVASYIRFPRVERGPDSYPPRAKRRGLFVVFAGNFTPLPRLGYRLGVPRKCDYLEVLNTDAAAYGGSGIGNLGRVKVEEVPCHGYPQSIVVTLPPLAGIFLVPELEDEVIEIDTPAAIAAAADAPPVEVSLRDAPAVPAPRREPRG